MKVTPGYHLLDRIRNEIIVNLVWEQPPFQSNYKMMIDLSERKYTDIQLPHIYKTYIFHNG